MGEYFEVGGLMILLGVVIIEALRVSRQREGLLERNAMQAAIIGELQRRIAENGDFRAVQRNSEEKGGLGRLDPQIAPQTPFHGVSRHQKPHEWAMEGFARADAQRPINLSDLRRQNDVRPTYRFPGDLA